MLTVVSRPPVRTPSASPASSTSPISSPYSVRIEPMIPGPGASAGRGLWLANHFCDLVQVRSFPGELVVRMYFSP